jgi:hypothetical protein
VFKIRVLKGTRERDPLRYHYMLTDQVVALAEIGCGSASAPHQ